MRASSTSTASTVPSVKKWMYPFKAEISSDNLNGKNCIDDKLLHDINDKIDTILMHFNGVDQQVKDISLHLAQRLDDMEMGFFKHIPHESFMQYLDSKFDTLQKNMDELTFKSNFTKPKEVNYSKYVQQYLNGDFSIEDYLP